MKHLVGSVIRILIDYMDYVPLCAKLKSALEAQREWPEIRQILGKKKSFAYKNFNEECILGKFLSFIFDTFSMLLIFRITCFLKSSLILPLM